MSKLFNKEKVIECLAETDHDVRILNNPDAEIERLISNLFLVRTEIRA